MKDADLSKGIDLSQIEVKEKNERSRVIESSEKKLTEVISKSKISKATDSPAATGQVLTVEQLRKKRIRKEKRMNN